MANLPGDVPSSHTLLVETYRVKVEPLGHEELLRPLWELMQKQLSQSHLIGADETPVNMNYRTCDPETNQIEIRTKQAYFWVYRGEDRAPFTLFDFQSTRGQSAPEAFLADFHEGFLQTDGYADYHSVTKQEGVMSIGCWAHARRKFKEAVLSSPFDAAQALVYIRELYDVEREAQNDNVRKVAHN